MCIWNQNNRERRISKVAYFSSMLDVRQIVFDLAASRPDLFEFKFIVGATVSPWNPESTEPPRNREEMYQYVKNLTENMKKKNLNLTDVASSSFPPGYVSHISGLLSMGHTSYNPGKYKYLLVMDGGFDNRGPYALSGRLASFLASGAVVLLQVNRHTHAYKHTHTHTHIQTKHTQHTHAHTYTYTLLFCMVLHYYETY